METNKDLKEIFEIISPQEILMKIQTNDIIFLSEVKEKNLSSENVWKNDKTSPNIEIINYEKNIEFCYFNFFLIWPLKHSELLMKCFLDDSFIYSNNKCDHFHHIFSIEEDERLMDENIYTLGSVPYQIISKSNKKVSYPLQKIIDFSVNVVKFNSIISKKYFDNDSKNTNPTKNSFVEVHRENNDNGTFIAYEDFMVKCSFFDRTIVTIDSKEEFTIILTKTGKRIVENLNSMNLSDYFWLFLTLYYI